MKYNIRLTIKAIIRVEQMLGKPFPLLDYSNMEEVLKLLYCIILAGSPEVFTFESFCEIAEHERQLGAMLKELEKYNRMLDQFTDASLVGKTDEGEHQVRSMKEVAGMLIMAGIDPHYVMNEMELSDIPVLAEALDRKKREDMEASRLWTFLSVAPHIDTKKVRRAEDYFPFPWEIERQKREAAEAIVRDREMAEHFFKEGTNIFKNQ